ncbi:MAG: hypothetical protein SNI70_11365 [Rikenellaceae bacterium]
MKREIITISENGIVNVPSGKVMMSEYEIAELLGVMVPTVRGKIQTLLKSRMYVESCGGIVRGNRIVPEYFGLEVVIAVAFQVDSYEADRFRKFILGKLSASTQLPIYISMNDENKVSIFS